MTRKDIQTFAAQLLEDMLNEHPREVVCRIMTEASRQLGKLGIKPRQARSTSGDS